MSLFGLHTYIILISFPATVKIYPDKQLREKKFMWLTIPDYGLSTMVFPLKQQELAASRYHPQSKAENNELMDLGFKC